MSGRFALAGYASGVAGAVLVYLAYHEAAYNHTHRYAAGPSSVLAVGFGCCALVAFTVSLIAFSLTDVVHQPKIEMPSPLDPRWHEWMAERQKARELEQSQG